MTRAAALAGALLVAVGLGLFAWKAVGLGLPVAPTDPPGLWQVELRITARGSGERGSVRAALPSSDDAQRIFDERAASDPLVFSIRGGHGVRTGVWRGAFEGLREIVYGFRVQLSDVDVPLPAGASPPPPEDVAKRWSGATASLPSDAPALRERIASLDLPAPDDAAGRLRALHAFASDEIATSRSGSDDALVTLAQREGSPLGKARALVALLRAADFPARVVEGLRLRDDGAPEEQVWAEAFAGGRWVPMSPSDGFFARRPADRVALRAGDDPLVDGTSVDAIGHRWLALRERLRPDELASMMVPPVPALERFSLYRLPVQAQSALRILLLLPLGALVVAVFRNVVGIPTFGTFMPVLLAIALRGTALAVGLGMVGFVLLVGVLGRVLLDRLRLLLVPRLAVLLCFVVLIVTGFALLARGFGTGDLYTGVLFPMVIMTMLIERFSIAMAEEGPREALIKAGGSTAIAVATYPIFRSALAEHLMFGFPELVLVVMGVLVWIGGWTGYRLSDLIRFRLLARGAEAAR